MNETDAEQVEQAAGSTEKENPHAAAVLKLAAAMLRFTLIGTTVVAVVAAVLCAVLVGSTGLWGSLVGSAIAIGSALVTILLMRKTAALPPSFVMVAALGGYAIKIMLIFGVMTALRGVEALHVKSLGFTMLVVIMVGALAEFHAFRKTKLPTLIIEPK
jgi:ATP synthase protein I